MARQGLRFRTISAGPLVGTGPRAFLQGLARLARGFAQAWRAAAADRPDVALVTGGYVSVPVAFAARMRGVPLAVFLPDVRPGRAVALIARLADRVAVTHAAAQAHLPAGRTVVTGYPVRPAVRRADRAPSRARLAPGAGDLPVLLVFGGSQGARRLNLAVVDAAHALLAGAWLVHVTGPDHLHALEAARAALPAQLAARWRLFGYLEDDDMAAALAAADLVVSRAGAATLGEYPARGLPAILVPLAISGGHQWANADVLAAAGAAIVVPDAELDGPRLAAEVEALVADPARRARMARAARALDRPDAAAAIWAEVAALAGRRPTSDTPEAA